MRPRSESKVTRAATKLTATRMLAKATANQVSLVPGLWVPAYCLSVLRAEDVVLTEGRGLCSERSSTCIFSVVMRNEPQALSAGDRGLRDSAVFPGILHCTSFPPLMHCVSDRQLWARTLVLPLTEASNPAYQPKVDY